MEIIIGAAVSLFVQYLKEKLGTSEYWTLGLVIFVSIAVAALYTLLLNTGYWETFANVLVISGAFYTYIIARFETKK